MTTSKHDSPTLLPTQLLALPVVLVGLLGCNGHPIKPVEIDNSAVTDAPIALDVNKKVDVLLVLDNSGSMGEEQANLAANFGPFIEKLEEAGADYRIGITTTDLGGPNCNNPGRGGELIMSSCLDRPDSFVFKELDQYQVACVDNCALGDADLQVQPTAIRPDGELAPRPWIESYNGVSNLPEGVDPLAAFQCLAPQGISGCGWESTLEAMARAIGNMNDPTQPEYGFLREDALLAVLVVTDEADCSYRGGDKRDALFDSGAFWAEGMSYATSAVCWNAGTACTGGPSPYDDCRPADYDVDGNLTDDPSAAVLHPISRYVDMLEAVAENKAEGREVLVSLIAGVPEGYPEQPLVYAASDDVEFQKLFGIGAGCTSVVDGVEQTAVPPVRLRAIAEAFPVSETTIYSVCSADYSSAVADIVEGISKELPPACYPGCLLDVDPTTEELDYDCEVVQEVDKDREILPECEAGAGGPELPADADACWVLLTGDERAPACQVPGKNGEFLLLRRQGVSVPVGAEVTAACQASSKPSIDCP